MGIITHELIELDVDLKSKDSIINYIVDTLKKHTRIDDKDQLLTDIYEREEEASTSMGFKVAIPHAQSLPVLESSVVFLRLKDEADWNEDTDVRLIFGIFVPKSNADNSHLKILAKIARKLASEEFRNKLLEVETVEECEKLLQSING